jgi:hypothetical protein
MFIKRELTPYKEHEVNTPNSTSNFLDWRFVYGVFGGKTCRVWFVCLIILVSSFAFVVIKGPSLIKIISARNQDIIMVYEAVIKVDIYGVGLANTRARWGDYKYVHKARAYTPYGTRS